MTTKATQEVPHLGVLHILRNWRYLNLCHHYKAQRMSGMKSVKGFGKTIDVRMFLKEKTVGYMIAKERFFESLMGVFIQA